VLVELRRPYVDVSAGDLSLTLGLAAAPALEVLALDGVDGRPIELRLLGFSHQVLVGGGERLSETVACVPGVAGRLREQRTDGAYSFAARVERLTAQAYAARAAGLLARAADDPLKLAGRIADAPAAVADPRAVAGAVTLLPAFTALAARPLSGAGAGAGEVAWTTWHGYPQSGELVITDSRVRRPR
jgi:hypothetical protein